MPRTKASKAITSAIIYRGPSMIDGSPIVVIATGLGGSKSANSKTGAMVQTWIIRDDMSPTEALRTGKDAAICGGCVHRPKAFDGTKWFKRSCYVNVAQAPTSVYRALKRGSYSTISLDTLASLTAGLMVRLGSYGDPAAVPMDVWSAYTALAAGRTGYTHQWKSERLRAVTALCQASVDSPEEALKARALGLGYFHVTPGGAVPLAGEIVCPASEEAGKVTTCAACRMCDGASRLSITIAAHGIGKHYVQPKASRVLSVVS